MVQYCKLIKQPCLKYTNEILRAICSIGICIGNNWDYKILLTFLNSATTFLVCSALRCFIKRASNCEKSSTCGNGLDPEATLLSGASVFFIIKWIFAPSLTPAASKVLSSEINRKTYNQLNTNLNSNFALHFLTTLYFKFSINP